MKRTHAWLVSLLPILAYIALESRGATWGEPELGGGGAPAGAMALVSLFLNGPAAILASVLAPHHGTNTSTTFLRVNLLWVLLTVPQWLAYELLSVRFRRSLSLHRSPGAIRVSVIALGIGLTTTALILLNRARVIAARAAEGPPDHEGYVLAGLFLAALGPAIFFVITPFQPYRAHDSGA